MAETLLLGAYLWHHGTSSPPQSPAPGLAWAGYQAGAVGSQDTGLDLDIDTVCGTGKNPVVVIMWDPDVGPEVKLGH